MKRFHWIFAAALVAAVAPLSAAANNCPTASDLAGGIRLTSSEIRLINVYRSTADGVELTTIATLSDDSLAENKSVYSTPLALPLASSFAGTPSGTRYAVSTSGLRNLAAAGTWISDFDFSIDGVVSDTGTQTSRLINTGSHSIGGCPYDVWTVQRDIEYADGYTQRSEHKYSPELGIFFVETLFDSDGKAMASTVFDQIEAE